MVDLNTIWSTHYLSVHVYLFGLPSWELLGTDGISMTSSMPPPLSQFFKLVIINHRNKTTGEFDYSHSGFKQEGSRS